MKTFLGLFSLAALLLISFAVSGQAPTISYSTPQTYLAGFPITPLTPTGTHLANLAYSTPATLLSGLNKPDGIAIDASGNIYYSSAGANIVYKLAAGTTTPVSYGTGFNAPAGLALDASGNLYIADYGNNKVKKIPVGGGTPVSIGAINSPVSLACDHAGNVYVSGGTVNGLYKIAPGGSPVVLTSTTGTIAGGVTGMTIDAVGNVYYTGHGNIIKLAAGGGMLSVAASGVTPYALAIDASGNIFCSESTANDIKMIPADGSATVTVGIHTNGAEGIALDANDNVYVADKFGPDIKSISPVGGYFVNEALPAGLVLSSVTGTISGTPANTSSPANYTIAAYNSSAAGSTTLNVTVNLPPLPTLSYPSPKTYADDQAIVSLTPTSSSVASPGYSSNPTVVDSGYVVESFGIDAAGNIYFDNYETVYKLPVGSNTAITIASGFNNPQGIAVDGPGNVYVTEETDIKKIAAGGNQVTTFASGLGYVTSVATDLNGNVYLADQNNNVVEKIPSNGGTAVSLGSGFNQPYNVSVDAAGDVFVTDWTGSASNLKKILTSSGSVVTIATINAGFVGLTSDLSGDVFVVQGLPELTSALGYSSNSELGGLVEYPANGNAAVTLYTTTTSRGISVDSKGNIMFVVGAAFKELRPTGGYYFNSLPAGLQVSQSTGTISGSPSTTKAATNYTGIAYNLAGSATSTTSITIANPYLSALTLSRGTLSPLFAPATTSYTAFIGAATTGVTVTPTVANPAYTITVNGIAVASGHASPNIPLTTGPNTIIIVVTAADGINKTTYTLIAGTGSDDAYMSTIKLNNGATAISPTFAFKTLNYTAGVGNGTTSITVTPKVLDATATVTVNGTAVTSGTASEAIPLNVGANTITVEGYAQDGVTDATYTIVVTRAPSNDAYLSSLGVNTATLSPSFAFKTLNYTSNVTNGNSLVKVRPSLLQANATVTVNGMAVASGSYSPSIALTVGSNVIDVVVTAQDGITKETYTINITRAAPPDDAYQPVSVNSPNDASLLIGDDIIVHQGVSPNGDGIDDVFIIENILNHPDNKVMIMDRNGAIIYQAKGYDNLTKAFDGHSNITGKMELPGTYFYALDYTVNGVMKRKSGFIVLKY